MSTIQQWGRKESIIWPPRGFYYTYGAILLAVLITGFLVFIRFHFSLSPLEQYYLPYYLRTEAAGLFRPTGMYQLIYISDGKSNSRIAIDPDVTTGETQQFSGKPLPLALSESALKKGFQYIFREVQHPYQNGGLHAWLGHWIFADTSLSGLLATPLYCGVLALVLQAPFSIRKDIKRRKELRYGRRLKGPFLVTSRQFTKAVAGDGIGITTNDDKRPLRIPRNAENKHFLLVGDTGSGKSSIIRQMLYQVAARGESAIVYDPACEFVKQFSSISPWSCWPSASSGASCCGTASTTRWSRMRMACSGRLSFRACGSIKRHSGAMTELECSPRSKPAWRLPSTRNSPPA